MVNGWRRQSLGPTAAAVVEGNKFSGVEIHLSSKEYKENPTLSQADLKAMSPYIIQLYKEGKLPQFSPNAMRLGQNIDGNRNLRVHIDRLATGFNFSTDVVFPR